MRRRNRFLRLSSDRARGGREVGRFENRERAGLRAQRLGDRGARSAPGERVWRASGCEPVVRFRGNAAASRGPRHDVRRVMAGNGTGRNS